MSVTDPTESAPVEEAEGAGRSDPEPVGASNAADPRPTPEAPETSEALDVPEAPEAPEAPGPPWRSAVPNRPPRAHSIALGETPGAGTPDQQAVWASAGGDPAGGDRAPGAPHDPRGPAGASGPADSIGSSAAGGDGFGPPPPPETGFEMPEPQPKKPSFWQRGKVPVIAAVTALITSLIVSPLAVALTLYLTRDGGPGEGSLTNGQASSVSTGSVSAVAEKALPSVVSIEVGEGSGSGVIISSDGQILTNSHVVASADGDAVNVRFNDGSEAEAEVMGADPVSDLAVIKAEGVGDLTPAVFGDSDKVEVGADVVAIGSPLGLSGTVTSGVVSALERPVNTGAAEPEEPEQGDPFDQPRQEDSPEARTATVINAIQTDAPINPGNSGGPLMNMNAEVIGINTAIADTSQFGEAGSIGLGFAIPINHAKPIAEQLVAEGRADYAAIDATITSSRRGDGAAIVETREGGAAAAAGLRRGDIITSVNGESVEGPDALIAEVRSHRPGDTVELGYIRDGEEDTAEVTLSAQSADSIGS
ncbi:MAG: trypsin-like peptidase domain-containing protein [Nocardiopsaceae bacterium]|mgnify:CR=1 FL=1|nr:trypsin-like peptidase domain-containing protein [Nocardiopsaceae bacterium]